MQQHELTCSPIGSHADPYMFMQAHACSYKALQARSNPCVCTDGYAASCGDVHNHAGEACEPHAGIFHWLRSQNKGRARPRTAALVATRVHLRPDFLIYTQKYENSESAKNDVLVPSHNAPETQFA